MRALTEGSRLDLLFDVGVNLGIFGRDKLGFTGVVTMAFHGVLKIQIVTFCNSQDLGFLGVVTIQKWRCL